MDSTLALNKANIDLALLDISSSNTFDIGEIVKSRFPTTSSNHSEILGLSFKKYLLELVKNSSSPDFEIIYHLLDLAVEAGSQGFYIGNG